MSTHLNLLLTSDLADAFELLYFQVGSEGRRESRGAKLLRFLLSPWQLLICLIHNRPDIVHINTAMDAKAFWRDLAYLAVVRVLGCKLIVQVHGGELPQEFVSRHPIRRVLLRRALKQTDLVLLLASTELPAYRAFSPDLNIKVVANAVRTDPARLAGRPALLTGQALRLVYIGRLISAKGILDAVDAVALLRDQGMFVSLAFAGSGPDEHELRNKVSVHRLEDRVSFLGPIFGQSKVRLWLQSDVFIFPSYHPEGLPYSLLEAMAHKVVPITCPVGAIPDVITPDRHGLFVQAKNAASIARAIQWVDENRELASGIAEAAMARIEEAYSVGRLVADFRKIYSELR